MNIDLTVSQDRIKSLKEDKKQLAQQLQSRSTISSLRSIGVGDYDVDEDQVKIEKVEIRTQSALKSFARMVVCIRGAGRLAVSIVVIPDTAICTTCMLGYYNVAM